MSTIIMVGLRSSLSCGSRLGLRSRGIKYKQWRPTPPYTRPLNEMHEPNHVVDNNHLCPMQLVWFPPIDTPAPPYPLNYPQLVAPTQIRILDHPQILQERFSCRAQSRRPSPHPRYRDDQQTPLSLRELLFVLRRSKQYPLHIPHAIEILSATGFTPLFALVQCAEVPS